MISIQVSISGISEHQFRDFVNQLSGSAGGWLSVNTKLDALRASETKLENLMKPLDQKIKDLQDAVANNTAVTSSAKTLITAIPGMIADAVAKAQEAGATPEELESLTNLAATLAANDGPLSAAVVANTSADPGTALPPVVTVP